MNMHGIIEPIHDAVARPTLSSRARIWAKRQRNFCLFVLLPIVVSAIYLFGIASNQYESEAHFLVRRPGQTQTPGIGVSEALSMATGVSSAQGEQMSVADYLTSHDVVATLRREDHLVERLRRSGVDPINRLWPSNPTPELLLRYYLRQVQVRYNTDTGITSLRVRSYTPQDSYELAQKLLKLGEDRVNYINVRSYEDSVKVARTQLAEAENAVSALQSRITRFRQNRSDIDPKQSGTAQITLIASLTAELATARAQLAAMGETIDHRSPQYVALARRVQALQAQIAGQSARLTGGGDTIAGTLGTFEDLKLRQDFLAKRYDAAASALEKARADAARQQLYVVRVVEPNMPVKATYPHRVQVLAVIVVSLLLAYAIGWLIAAGMREHVA